MSGSVQTGLLTGSEKVVGTIPCLSLWQPHAWLIEQGFKKYERGWKTDYRGPLAIHAAKRWNAPMQVEALELIATLADSHRYQPSLKLAMHIVDGLALTLGRVVCVVDLVAVHYTGKYEKKWEPEDSQEYLGGFGLGRYAWELANVRSLPVKPEVRGEQGLFKVPVGVLGIEVDA